MDRHSTIDRDPGILVEGWLQPVRKGPLAGLAPPPESKVEAEKLLAWLRVRRDYSHNTLFTFLEELRRFAAFLAGKGKSLRDFSFEDYVEFIGRAGTESSPTAIRLYLLYLYEATGDERYKRLRERIKVPRRKRRLPDTLTREQVEKLLEECGRESLELKTLVALIYETGARAGEILHLKGKDIVFDEHGARIVIRRSKSQPRALRVVLYAALLAQHLDLVKPGPEDRIFRYEYNTYLYHLRRAWRRAGLPPIKRKFHVLRHTRATELLRTRVFSEKEMMLWFGWQTRGMIDVYSHITMEDAERAYLAALKGESIPAPQPPKPVECPKCRSLNPPEARFCLKCGAPMKPEAVKEAARQEIQLTELLREIEELKKMVLGRKS